MRSTFRSTRAFMLATLCSAFGCDKSNAAAVDAIVPAGTAALDIAGRPQLLFQIFGDHASLRVVPIAAVVNGGLRPIGLTARGWHVLDSLYFQPGTAYPVFRDAVEIGTLTIARGMWSPGHPQLYPLAGCSSPKPIASGTVAFSATETSPYLELIASSAPMTKRAPVKRQLLTAAEVAKLARAVGHDVGKAVGIEPSELDSLDFHARLLVTGAATDPTLLVSFIDPNSGDIGPGAGHTTHLFALAEHAASGWQPAYKHAVSGDARAVEYRRLVDHVDVNGDGVDELLLEAWRYGADNALVALSYRGTEWRETMRITQNWCLDPPKTKR